MAEAGGVRAGGAFVEIFAKDSALTKGLKKAKKEVEDFGKSVLKIGAGLGAIGAGITGPLIAATAHFAESGAALKDMSERTGVSVESLSVLGFAAKQSGADIGAVEVGVRKMQKALVAGSEENKQAVGTFASLGLSVQVLSRLKPEEQFAMIGKRIASIKDETARAGAAMMIFGRSGTQLIPMLTHMEKLSREAHEFGLVMSTETAEDAKKLKDSMGLLEAVIGKITGKIGSALAPSFEAWNIQMATLGKQMMHFIDVNKPLIVTAFQVGLAITAAGVAVVGLGTAIVGVSAMIGAISTIVATLHTGLLLLATPIGGLIVGFAATTTAMGAWGDAIKLLKGQFGSFLKIAQDTFKGIGDAIKAGDIELAAKILFAGLKVEFLKGTADITSIWSAWSIDITKIFRGISFNIASHIIDIQAAIEGIQAKAGSVAGTGSLASVAGKALGITPAIGKAFDAVGKEADGVANRWDAAISQMKLELIEMTRVGQFEWKKFTNLITGTFLDAQKHGKSLLEINKAAAEASAAVKEGFEERKTGREKTGIAQSPEDAAKEEAEQNKALAEIEKRRQEAQAALDSGENVEVANRRKAAADNLATAQKELDDVKKELDRLRINAAVNALPGGKKKSTLVDEAFPDEIKNEPAEGLTPEGLDKGIEKAKQKVDIAGSFQASTVAGLGAGKSVVEDQLSEQKKGNKELEAIRKNTAKQAVFQ